MGAGVRLSIDDWGLRLRVADPPAGDAGGRAGHGPVVHGDLLVDPRAAAIVSSTVELAHRLGLRLVAQDDERLAHLAVLGSGVRQGYLRSRPVPAAAREQWLDDPRQQVIHPHAVVTAFAGALPGP